MKRRRDGWSFGLILALGSVTVAEAQGPTRKYSIELDAKLKVAAAGQTQNLATQTRLDYSLKPLSGSRIESSIDELALTVKVDDGLPVISRMNRDAFVMPDGAGGTKTLPAQDAPPALKEMLAQFSAPYAVHTLGPEGEEVGSPTIMIKEGTFSETKAHLLTRIFHVRFPKNKAKWTETMEIPMGSGQTAKGDVTFEKVGLPGSDGSVRVKLSGKLKAAGSLGNAVLKRGDYEITGLQIHSPKTGDWISGTYDMKIDFDATDPARGEFNGKGSMSLILKTRP